MGEEDEAAVAAALGGSGAALKGSNRERCLPRWLPHWTPETQYTQSCTERLAHSVDRPRPKFKHRLEQPTHVLPENPRATQIFLSASGDKDRKGCFLHLDLTTVLMH